MELLLDRRLQRVFSNGVEPPVSVPAAYLELSTVFPDRLQVLHKLYVWSEGHKHKQMQRSKQRSRVPNLTLCVPCIIFNYINKTNKMHSFYIYLFYNLYTHSACCERSYPSSPGVFVVYFIHSSVQNRADVSSRSGFLLPENQSSWTRLHDFVQSCEYSK